MTIAEDIQIKPLPPPDFIHEAEQAERQAMEVMISALQLRKEHWVWGEKEEIGAEVRQLRPAREMK